MSQTAQVPARETIFHILPEAARLELQPRDAAFHRQIHVWGGCPEPHFPPGSLGPRCRRIVCRLALHDLSRWCVSHALRMLASVCRGGIPVPSRKPLSGALFPWPRPDRLRKSLAHARWGVRRCAERVRECTVSGWPSPTKEGDDRMTRHAEHGKQRSLPTGRPGDPHSAARTCNPSPAAGGCSPKARGTWPTITTPRPRSAAWRRIDDGFGTTTRVLQRRRRVVPDTVARPRQEGGLYR